MIKQVLNWAFVRCEELYSHIQQLLITSKIQRKLFIHDSITFSSKSAIKKVKTGQYFTHFLKK